MRAWVLDTSALLRLYVPDGPMPDGLAVAVEHATRGDGLLLAPDLLWAELGAVVVRKQARGELNEADADAILAAAAVLPIHTLGHDALLEPAVALARRTGLTVYDALFAAAATIHDADLLTADRRLARAHEAGAGAR